ncbi:MAG: hypothetical protein M5R36_13645 [Deltaproteobacteria bacterium]|nr:hypothetical protein [Deltaproteobacteria bacterium]
MEFPDDRLHSGFRIEDILSEDFDTPDLFAFDLMRDPDEDLTEDERRPFIQRIATMTMVDRLLLALRGNKEARTFLIKSPSKMIQDCVLRNPRITPREIADAVKERSTSQNVIATICRNREWVRSYEIAFNLLWHPKTPMAFVVRHIGRLNAKDLHRLAHSRQVPATTAQQAKRLLNRRPGAK